LLNGLENSVTLIGKTKHHLLCQSHRTKDNGTWSQSKTSRETESFGTTGFVADKKSNHFDMMIDIAEEEYKIDIRKNSPPEQSTILNKKNNKQ
jgi:hypothetical protein